MCMHDAGAHLRCANNRPACNTFIYGYAKIPGITTHRNALKIAGIIAHLAINPLECSIQSFIQSFSCDTLPLSDIENGAGVVGREQCRCECVPRS